MINVSSRRHLGNALRFHAVGMGGLKSWQSGALAINIGDAREVSYVHSPAAGIVDLGNKT
jgi:hypothetical protein